MGLIAPAWAPVWGLLRAVPLWSWALCAALAWGGWQRHQARGAAQDLAAVQLQAALQREAALAAAVHQPARIATEQGAIADDTRQHLDRARADARRAADHAQRLRQQLAAGGAAAASAAAAGDCAQPPPPPECTPSCSAALSIELESWLSTPTRLQPPAPPASAATTH